MKYLVDTADGFVETVDEDELIRWGESFRLGLEMAAIEAIKSLETVGYKVERLEEKENLEEM